GRSDTRSSMPVTGWDTRFNKVSALLYLPPGNKLLAAPGVDSAGGSWFGQWQLLDYFLVLIITIAAWKLFGRGAGLVALFALALSYHEIDAPAWLWLNILVATALLRVAPAGRLRNSVRTYLAGSALVLVLVLVPFIAGQLRMAIYPQLEPQYGLYQPGRDSGNSALAPNQVASLELSERRFETDAIYAEDAAKQSARDTQAALEEVVVTGARSRLALSSNFARYAPNAIVQAGPGIPTWQWNAYRLDWAGPVDADQDMRLVILPRWAVTIARFFEVLMLLGLTAIIAAELLKRRITLPGGLGIGRSAAGVLLAGFVGMTLSASPPAYAQTPDRLLTPPDCVPRCAEIVSADVAVSGDAVRIQLVINTLEDVAIPLPGNVQGWRPNAVSVNGTANAQVLRSANQNLWLRVSPGRHNVVLSGTAANVDSLEIPFPTPPRVVRTDADGWFVAGVKDRRLLSGSLQFSRLQSAEGSEGAPRWESNRFPPFVKVERVVDLGLDWQLTTTVTRIAPQQGALTLELPLVAGESVLTDGLTAEEGSILVSMNPRQQSVTWQSNLPRTSPLVLVAAAGMPWSEIWYARVGTVWHAEFSGVPESESGGQGPSVRTATFHPRGGEELTIVASRPEAAEGSTLAFDSVNVAVSQGARSRTSTMDLRYRSTRGAQHVIRLPEAADVTLVRIDGEVEPLRAESGVLTVPILPGQHSIAIVWREDGEVSAISRMPDIDIGAPASNITLNLAMPENRWLLATSGPKLGPAVLYWSELAVLILFAVILGRIDWTPLATRHWLLLGLGFSTFNWPVLGFVAAWILIVGAREKWRVDMPWWRFNLWQIAVMLLTVTSLIMIVASLPAGLLGTPDMHIIGNNSWGNSLNWFADRSASVLPSAIVFSVPTWIYKVLILAWALWLSFALLRWLPWVWQCFSKEGFFRSRKHDQLDASTGEA
ncbi:MAG: hypothetical protein ACE5F8_01600, partial [Woeseiaceae bacterium]